MTDCRPTLWASLSKNTFSHLNFKTAVNIKDGSRFEDRNNILCHRFPLSRLILMIRVSNNRFKTTGNSNVISKKLVSNSFCPFPRKCVKLHYYYSRRIDVILSNHLKELMCIRLEHYICTYGRLLSHCCAKYSNNIALL